MERDPMKPTGFLLEPIPETNQYLITRRKEGKIIKLEMMTTEWLIENWAKTRKGDKEVLIEGLREGAEIELFD